MDDMELTSAERMDIYEQIQNFVFENKVSTLYIAQVKRKHVLNVMEHYNISKMSIRKFLIVQLKREKIFWMC